MTKPIVYGHSIARINRITDTDLIKVYPAIENIRYAFQMIFVMLFARYQYISGENCKHDI